MNSEKLEQDWQEICSRIKTYEDIDPTQVNAFFSRLEPQAMSEGFLMVTADNDFIRNWVERHYTTSIKRALFDMYGIEFTVIIEIDTTAAERQPTMQRRDAAPAVNPFAPAAAPAPTRPAPADETTVAEASGETGVGAADSKAVASAERAETPEKDQDQEQGGEANEAAFGGDSPYTFEKFVIGDSNRMAFSMAVAVAEAPGKKPHLNPLFIYGKSGLGKTHLLRAIKNYVNAAIPELSAVYVDSSELLSDYMDAAAAHDKQKSSFKRFKDRYENADILLIDDVQYLQGKKQTLDIVFQIFNKITSQGKQVVLSADRAPKNIDIDERYKSRFNSGGTFDVQAPEIETKLGIVRNVVKEYRELENNDALTLSDDVQMFIAENSSSNIRELRSAVTSLLCHSAMTNSENITVGDAKHILESHFSEGRARSLTIEDIQSVVESFYQVSHADLVGKKRNRNIASARQVAIYLCRTILDIPYNDIGQKFGRDHSTVMHSVSTVDERLKEDRDLREEMEALRGQINER